MYCTCVPPDSAFSNSYVPSDSAFSNSYVPPDSAFSILQTVPLQNIVHKLDS